MKHTPLIWRILGAILLTVLFVVACLHPLLTQGEAIAMAALSHLDKPYVFGSLGPDSYDCSGLTKDAYGRLGMKLIHSSQFVAYDYTYETVEDVKDLVPGDLIFFDTISDKDECDHVGVWLGMNRFVHASSSEEVVMISSFDEKWQGCYSWSKHIMDPYSVPEINRLLELAESKLKNSGETE